MAQRQRVRLLAAGTACGRDFLRGTAATVTTGARYDPARTPGAIVTALSADLDYAKRWGIHLAGSAGQVACNRRDRHITVTITGFSDAEARRPEPRLRHRGR
ncbi:hypothetical protein, partial [Rathayibacter iranicus]